MENSHRFPKNELLRYRFAKELRSGEQYLLTMANLSPAANQKPLDYALRARPSRDGLEAYPFYETAVKAKKSDADLYWTVTEEENGVSLYSPTAKKYLSLTDQGAWLTRKKQILTLTRNGETFCFSAVDRKGNTQYLSAKERKEAPHGMIFTAGSEGKKISFALLQRVYGVPVKPKGERRLTAGTVADIHIDYGIQLFRPYVRKTALQTALGYQRRYDLDALILCGDSISDNSSGGGKSYPYLGAVQGKWPYERFLRSRNALHAGLQKAFRREECAKNVFHISGNHEYQVGDRQPRGIRYNSAYYTDLLPKDIQNPLFEDFTADLGDQQNLLCYKYEVNGYPFLMLNTPAYPQNPNSPVGERPTPAHNAVQVAWLEARLKEIEEKQGRYAVIFVSSHYPFMPYCYQDDEVPENVDCYLRLSRILNRYPNLFFFYGHTHGGNLHPTFTETRENMTVNLPVDLFKAEANGSVFVGAADDPTRGKFKSDLLLADGFRENYGGSMTFYKNMYFKSDGFKTDSWLSHLNPPFFQGCAVEVYDDRVILTMQNFGPKDGLKNLPGAKYNLKPLVCILQKEE